MRFARPIFVESVSCVSVVGKSGYSYENRYGRSRCVGLRLAIQFARSNVNVIGVNVDKTKVRLSSDGQPYSKHIWTSTIAKSIICRLGL